MLILKESDPMEVQTQMSSDTFDKWCRHAVRSNKDGGKGNSLFHYAIISGREDMLQRLIARGDDPNLKNKEGDTPLHKAVLWGKKNMAHALIKAGALINEKNNAGLTPLHFACGQTIGFIKLLLSHGADINATDVDGNTPMHRAVLSGNRSVLLALVLARANPFIKNKTGKTPIQYTSVYNTYMRSLLKESEKIYTKENASPRFIAARDQHMPNDFRQKVNG